MFWVLVLKVLSVALLAFASGLSLAAWMAIRRERTDSGDEW